MINMDMKRLFDFLGTGIGLLLMLPVLGLLVVLIRLFIGSPVFCFARSVLDGMEVRSCSSNFGL